MQQQLLIQHEVFLDKEGFILLAFGHASQSSQLAPASVFWHIHEIYLYNRFSIFGGVKKKEKRKN